MTKRLMALTAVALALGLVFTAWMAFGGRTPLAVFEPTVHAEYRTAGSLGELNTISSVIVIGTVKGIAGTRNLARDPNDPSKADPDLEIEGVDYRIKVESYVKGSGPDELLVTQAKSIHGKKVGGKGGRYQGFSDLASGGRYILFLRPSIDGSGRMVGVAEPWRFRLQGGTVQAEGRWEGAAQAFPAKAEREFMDELSATTK